MHHIVFLVRPVADLRLTSTGRLDCEGISDHNEGFANDFASDLTFRELDHNLQRTHSDLRRDGNRGSWKLRDPFSSDMAKVTGAAVAAVIGDLGLGFD